MDSGESAIRASGDDGRRGPTTTLQWKDEGRLGMDDDDDGSEVVPRVKYTFHDSNMA